MRGQAGASAASASRMNMRCPACSILKPILPRLFLLLALTAIASRGAPFPSFRIFSIQDGLVRNWVTRIHRDSHGYLWFCTVEGISLFDGYRFTNFSTADGLPSRL